MSRNAALKRGVSFSNQEKAMHVQQMIASHPRVMGQTNDTLVRCIEACYDCAQTCTACADASLREKTNKPLLQATRLSLDCGDIGAATGAIGTRRTATSEDVMRTMLEACIVACRICADECGLHAAHHEHCRICAETCRSC